MNEITKAEKLYTVILNDGLEFVITQSAKNLLESEMLTENFVNIGGNTFNKYEIKRIVEKKQKSSRGYKYICDYGTRHEMYGKDGVEECKCFEKFGIEYRKFYDWLTDRNYKFEYASDIKKEWQDLFLKQKYEKRN